MTKETAIGMLRTAQNGNQMLEVLDTLAADSVGYTYAESPMIESVLGVATLEPIEFWMWHTRGHFAPFQVAMWQCNGCPPFAPNPSQMTYLSHMNNGANAMQVYAVIGGINYEGEMFDTLRLFDCKSAAEAYEAQLKDEFGIDYVLMQVREVEMQSAIVA